MFDPVSLFNAEGKLVVAGALGGVVRWLSLRETWQEGLVSIVVGAICAVYLTPLFTPSLTAWSGLPEAARLTAFMVGIGGIGVVGFVIDLWRTWRKKGRDL